METPRTPVSEKSDLASSQFTLSSFSGLKKSWSTHVGFDFLAEGNDLLDHLANERTWHNWLALSITVSWLGVVVAQMARINCLFSQEHARLLRVEACVCQALAIVILLLGSYRFFREQSAIKGTGDRASQSTLLAAGFLILGLLCSFFAVLIRIEQDPRALDLHQDNDE